MKIAVLLTLIVLSACSVNSKHEDCTINGVKVDCDAFSDGETKDAIALRVEITAAAEISESQIEILENAEDSASEDGLECSLVVYAGQVFKIKKYGWVLYLEHEEDKATFHSTANPNEWKNEMIDGKLKVTTFLTLEDGKFKSSMVCSRES